MRHLAQAQNAITVNAFKWCRLSASLRKAENQTIKGESKPLTTGILSILRKLQLVQFYQKKRGGREVGERGLLFIQTVQSRH